MLSWGGSLLTPEVVGASAVEELKGSGEPGTEAEDPPAASPNPNQACNSARDVRGAVSGTAPQFPSSAGGAPTRAPALTISSPGGQVFKVKGTRTGFATAFLALVLGASPALPVTVDAQSPGGAVWPLPRRVPSRPVRSPTLFALRTQVWARCTG